LYIVCDLDWYLHITTGDDMSPVHTVTEPLSCTSPVCFPQAGHGVVLYYIDWPSQATDSSAPIQLVHGHLRTDPC